MQSPHLPKQHPSFDEDNITVQAFIESTYDGYWDWHIQDDYEYMSPRFWEMFGYTPEEKPHHPSAWQDMIFKEDLEKVMEAFNKHVQTRGEQPFNMEVRYKHKNGSTVYVYCRGHIIKWDKEGNPLRMIGTHTDFTEKKRFIDELQAKNRELDDFAHIISHDLKQPLRGISYYAKMAERAMSKNELPDQLEAKQRLDGIQELVKSMERLLGQIFHCSRISQESQDHQETDLNALVHDVIKFLWANIEEQNINVKVVNHLPRVRCYSLRGREVWYNLIVNAIKYNDKENKVIEIGVEDESAENPVYFVRDNGIGISKEHQESIFKIFRRLNRDDQYGAGTGAGLTIVKKVIDMHGGKIWVESEVGEGTVFYFTLR